MLWAHNPSTPRHVIGLMSGTSLDGVDACLVEITGPVEQLQWRIVDTESAPFPVPLKQAVLGWITDPGRQVQQAQAQGVHPLAMLGSLNRAVALAYVPVVRALQARAKTPVDALAAHGQTLFHCPPSMVNAAPEGLLLPHSWQLLDSATLAAETGVPCVSNFRALDMAYGGQGAPLVPFADRLLFGALAKQHSRQWVCIQNIGGIGNVTGLRYQPGQPELDVVAFDTGPGNMLMDRAAQHFLNQPFDRDGAGAAQGTVNEAVLTGLMAQPYFDTPPPKSTGREWLTEPFFDQCLAQANAQGLALTPQDGLATLTAWTAESIAQQTNRWLTQSHGGTMAAMVVGGGGAHNPTLMRILGEALARVQGQPVALSTHADFGITNSSKEALAFALLGWATLCGVPCNVPSATGARVAAPLGQVVFPAIQASLWVLLFMAYYCHSFVSLAC